MDQFISLLVVILVLSVIFFLITREFWCWYWKVNERLYNLKQIESYLKTIAKQYSKENAVDIVPEHELTGKVAKCKECNSEIVIQEADTNQGYFICPYCGIRTYL